MSSGPANTKGFIAGKSYGPCTICKQELTRGTLVRTVRLMGYQTNVSGYAHGHDEQCKNANN